MGAPELRAESRNCVSARGLHDEEPRGCDRGCRSCGRQPAREAQPGCVKKLFRRCIDLFCVKPEFRRWFISTVDKVSRVGFEACTRCIHANNRVTKNAFKLL